MTGAGQGLGRATALRLASQGAKVLVADINGAAVQSVVDEIGANAMGAPVDVTSPEQVEDALDQAVKKWGGVHTAVNCAGILARGWPSTALPFAWRTVKISAKLKS